MSFHRDNDSKGLATRHDDDVETLVRKNLDVRVSLPANLLMFGASLVFLMHISLIAGASVLVMLPLVSLPSRPVWGRRLDEIAADLQPSESRRTGMRKGRSRWR